MGLDSMCVSYRFLHTHLRRVSLPLCDRVIADCLCRDPDCSKKQARLPSKICPPPPHRHVPSSLFLVGRRIISPAPLAICEQGHHARAILHFFALSLDHSATPSIRHLLAPGRQILLDCGHDTALLRRRVDVTPGRCDHALLAAVGRDSDEPRSLSHCCCRERDV